jgi:hypothetical protein
MAKKEKKEEVSVIKLINYKLSTTIKTGDYSNITAEINVEGESIDEVEKILTQHIDGLILKYHNCLVPKAGVRPVFAPEKSTAFQTAQRMLTGAKDEVAKEAVRVQIRNSTKLSDIEKTNLLK